LTKSNIKLFLALLAMALVLFLFWSLEQICEPETSVYDWVYKTFFAGIAGVLTLIFIYSTKTPSKALCGSVLIGVLALVTIYIMNNTVVTWFGQSNFLKYNDTYISHFFPKEIDKECDLYKDVVIFRNGTTKSAGQVLRMDAALQDDTVTVRLQSTRIPEPDLEVNFVNYFPFKYRYKRTKIKDEVVCTPTGYLDKDFEPIMYYKVRPYRMFMNNLTQGIGFLANNQTKEALLFFTNRNNQTLELDRMFNLYKWEKAIRCHISSKLNNSPGKIDQDWLDEADFYFFSTSYDRELAQTPPELAGSETVLSVVKKQKMANIEKAIKDFKILN